MKNATKKNLSRMEETTISLVEPINLFLFPVAAFAARLQNFPSDILMIRKDAWSKSEIHEDLIIIEESLQNSQMAIELVDAEQRKHYKICDSNERQKNFFDVCTKLRNKLREKYTSDEARYKALIIQGKLALALVGTTSISF